MGWGWGVPWLQATMQKVGRACALVSGAARALRFELLSSNWGRVGRMEEDEVAPRPGRPALEASEPHSPRSESTQQGQSQRRRPVSLRLLPFHLADGGSSPSLSLFPPKFPGKWVALPPCHRFTLIG